MAITRINLQRIFPSIKDGATILVPSLRVKDAILSEYLASINSSTILTPNILPVDIFIKEYWEINARKAVCPCNKLQLLTSQEEFLLWNEIIEDSLNKFPLLNPKETANAVAHSYHLARQWIEPNVFTQDLLANSSITDVAAFSQWIQIFQKKCNNLQLITLVDAIVLFTELLKSAKLKTFPKEITLVNFYDPPPIYQKLFNTFPNSSLILTTEDIPKNKSKGQSLSKKKFEFDNQNSELRSCAKWVKEILMENPTSHIGIISNNKEKVRQKFEFVLREELNSSSIFWSSHEKQLFNSTNSSQRLIDIPFIYDALLVLELGRERHNIEDLTRLLQSPFLTCSESLNANVREDQARINLAACLRLRGQTTISNRELSYLAATKEDSHYCKEFSEQLVQFKTEIRRLKHKKTTQKWGELFSDLLSIFGWPGVAVDKNKTKFLKQWKRILDQYRNASRILPEIDYPTALAKLRLLCSQQTITNEFDASLAISFHSVAESIGLEFDHIWLAGFNDQNWPEPCNPSPFIPYTTQKAASIPGCHSDIQLDNGKRLFAQLLSATKSSVQASYFKSDGEQLFRPSSFILNFETSNAFNDTAPILNKACFLQMDNTAIELITDRALPLSKTETVRAGANLISEQSSCPFRAYAKNRLRLQPEPPIEIGISKMARGTAIHIALDYLFEKIDTSNKLSSENLTEIVKGAALKGVDFLTKRFRDTMTPKFQQIEFICISNLLNQFIKIDRKRPAFQIIAREHTLNQRYQNLSLNVKIDRIDQLENGGTALIDYKTGKYTVSAQDWLKDRPKDMQLPLYHLIASENGFDQIVAVAIGHIHPEKISYSGLAASSSFSDEIKPVGKEKSPDLNWEQIIQYWSDKVQQIAADFNAGVCDVNPIDTGKTCTYCGLQALCRIQEMSESDIHAPEGENN